MQLEGPTVDLFVKEMLQLLEFENAAHALLYDVGNERLPHEIDRPRLEELVLDFGSVGFMDSSGIALIIGRCEVSEAIIKTAFKNLSVIPATIDLAGAELELYDMEENNENFAKLALDSIKDDYDYIFIDCPPSLGMLTIKALSISDGIVIPMQCEFYSLEGMSQLLNTVKKIRKLYNPTLQIVGILLTMYNARLTLTYQVVEELKKYYADILFKVPISRTVRLSEAPGYGKPICYHDPYGKGSLEYAAVAKELMMRI